MRYALHKLHSAVMILLIAVLGGCFGQPETPARTHDASNSVTDLEERPYLPARQRFVTAQQTSGGPAYAVRSVAGPEVQFVARHPAWTMRTELGRDGVHIVHDDALLALTLLDYGRQGARLPAADVEPTAHGNRVEYNRGEVTEWYVNGPLGLQQGFTFPTRLPGTGRLEIAMRIASDLYPRMSADESAVLFRDARGQTRMRYSDLYVNDATGRALAAVLTLEDDLLVIEIDDTEATYPVTVDPLFGMETKLTPVPPVGDESFGASVFLDGDMAVIGATGSDDPVSNAGSAHVYTRSDGVWSPEAELIVPGATSSDALGTDVGFSGDTVIVGGSRVWTAPAGRTGAAYIFVRSDSDGQWILQQRLTPSAGWVNDDLFGQSVAIEGDIAVVGGPGRDDDGTNSGAVFVYTREDATWTEQQRLIPSGAFQNVGFGSDVAIDNGTIIVGASVDDGSGTNAGAAYVFVLVEGLWTEQQKLTAQDAASHDYLGDAVAIRGDMAVIGARGDDDQGSASGSVYVFQRDGDVWTETQKLFGSTAGELDEFGSAVAFDGSIMIVGAYGEYDTRLSGAIGTAFIFENVADSWTESVQLYASDPNQDDQFGRRVAITGNTVFSGAHRDDDVATNAGAVYVYELELVGGSCSDPDDCATGHCVDGVCCDEACGDAAEDDCQACSIEAGAETNGLCGPLSADAAPNVICRASRDSCDVAETCQTGSVACPADVLVEAAVECREATLPCDIAEVCNGISPYCPTDGFVAFDTVCHDSTGPCDPAELCSGLGPDCPADVLSEAGDECRVAAGPCDATETCSGDSVECPTDDVLDAGTECRPAIRICDAREVCDGINVDCPVDEPAPDGTACDDGFACNGAETCTEGACLLGPYPDCNDGNACTFDSCVEPTGCVNPPIATCCNEEADCDDGNRCTRDVCSGPGGTCQHAPIDSCCWNDADCNDRDACTMDRCTAGVCTHGQLTGCCAVDADCDDSDPCTDDACVGLRCVRSLSASCGSDAGSSDAGSDDDGGPDMGPDVVEEDGESDDDTDVTEGDAGDDESAESDGTNSETRSPDDGCGCGFALAGDAEVSDDWWLALFTVMGASIGRRRKSRKGV